MAFNKFGAKKVIIDGITFHSTAEGRRYRELKLMERAGEIKDLELQTEFVILDGFRYKDKKIRAVKYKADFKYFENDVEVVEDVKGYKTKDYILKKKMFLSRYGDLYDFRELQI